MAGSVKAAKKALRLEMKNKLTALPHEQLLTESQKLIAKFLALPAYTNSQRVAVYLSMSDEVQTESLLQSIFSMGKICFIPRYDTSNTKMDMLRLHSMDDIASLPLTRWNVRQPALDDTSRENALQTGGLDLVLVPGLAFTKEGHRLGRGKGYYDTFLEQCHQVQKKPPVTVALSLSLQLLTQVPTLSHDALVDLVITPD